MFENIGWGEILILLVAALFILGPERLPEAAAWMGKSLRKVRDFATGARQQLKDEMGPEYEQFRKPLEDLRQLRSFDPKRAAIQHLFDGDSDPLGLDNINGTNGNGTGGSGAGGAGGAGGTGGHTNGAMKPNGYPAGAPQPESLKPGEKPPVDPDAT